MLMTATDCSDISMMLYHLTIHLSETNGCQRVIHQNREVVADICPAIICPVQASEYEGRHELKKLIAEKYAFWQNTVKGTIDRVRKKDRTDPLTIRPTSPREEGEISENPADDIPPESSITQPRLNAITTLLQPLYI